MKSVLSGDISSGVRAVGIGLAHDVWEGTLQGSLADYLEMDEEEIVTQEFQRSF